MLVAFFLFTSRERNAAAFCTGRQILHTDLSSVRISDCRIFASQI